MVFEASGLTSVLSIFTSFVSTKLLVWYNNVMYKSEKHCLEQGEWYVYEYA